MSALPHLVMTIIVPIGGQLADLLRKRGKFRAVIVLQMVRSLYMVSDKSYILHFTFIGLVFHEEPRSYDYL